MVKASDGRIAQFYEHFDACKRSTRVGSTRVQAGSQQTWCPAVDAWLKRTMAGWRACFITADRELPSGIGFKPSKRTPLCNGALDCRLFEFELYAETRRADRVPVAFAGQMQD